MRPCARNTTSTGSRLEAAWKPKNDTHAQASQYIYEDWSKSKDPAALKEALPKARAAFDVCRKAKDFLTPRKLQTLSVTTHAAELEKRRGSLQKDDKDDVELLKLIGEDAEQLARLIKDVDDFLKQATAP